MFVRQAKADAAAVGRCEHMRSAEGVTLRRCGAVPMSYSDRKSVV